MWLTWQIHLGDVVHGEYSLDAAQAFQNPALLEVGFLAYLARSAEYALMTELIE